MSAIIPKVSKLSSRVIRVLGCNPSPMTLQGTNTYLVGNGNNRLLIDCGQPDVKQYITNLKNVIEENGIKLSQIVITHWHYDHIGGVKDVLKSLNLSNDDCKIYKICDKEEDIKYNQLFQLNYLSDGQKLCSDGATLRVVSTPGHTKDHLVLVLEEENALFSGDCILGEGTAVFEDLHSYMKSLENILSLRPAVIYPGHGGVIDQPMVKIQEYIDHRNQREEQIIKVLSDLKQCLTPLEIVKIVYKDISEHLYSAAAFNVSHHLEKLVKDNKFYRCKCFFTNNYFLPKYKIHVKYTDNDQQFWSQFEDQLMTIGCNTQTKKDEVLTQLKTEFNRRLNLDIESEKRIQFIESHYKPKHEDIYRLDEKHLQKSFIDLVLKCKTGHKLEDILPYIQTISLEKRVFKFDVFTQEFCHKLIEEMDYFNDSPNPKSRPNTMNNYGILLNELGFDQHFVNPLRENYLNPLAKVFFPDWVGDGLDSHRVFSIKYGLNEDKELFTHFDNSEITLNICLGKTFSGSEVYFGDFRTDHKLSNDLSVTPVIHSPGVGLFHLGQQMHGSVPLTDGERHNLVLWMRSSKIRNKLCPMCDSKPQPIKALGFGDGFTKIETNFQT